MPNLKVFVDKYIKKKILTLVQFNGSYKTTPAHIDSSANCNLYYLKSGKKKVIVIPYQYTHYLEMYNDIDNITVCEDKDNDKKKYNKNWIQKIPGYWETILNEGDVLFFNSSKCIHKFYNLTDDCEAFSVRMFNWDASELVLKNDIFNYKMAKQLEHVITTPNYIRTY